MSILDKLVKGQREQARRAPRLHKNAAEHGTLDRWTIDDTMRSSERFRERIERQIELDDAGKVYEPSVDIHQDLFLGAHTSGETHVRPPDEMRPSHRFGRDVIGEVFKTEDFKDAKPYMEGDDIASMLFTYPAADKLDELMRDESVREQLENDQQQHEDEDRLGDILDHIEDLRGEARDAHGKGEPTDEIAGEMRPLIEEREKLIDQLANAPAPGPIPTPVKEKIEQAAAEGKKRVDAWGTIAGLGATDLEHATPDEAMALVEAWMQLPNFEEFSRLLGRVQRDFRAQESRNIIDGTDEVVGIELGNNLTSALPSELVRLSHPDTARSFMRDYMDESLLQFSTQGTERVNDGPAVLCVDLSGSMDGRKALEAVVVAIAFVRLMHRRHRDAAIVVFNGAPMWEHHFRKRDGIEMAQLLELASLRPSGGTNITKAVARAEKVINSAPAFKLADVVVITDGEDHSWSAVTDGIRERFEKAGVRRHGIAIGHTPEPGGWLLKFCDDALSVNDLTEATGDLVRATS
jgi:uncharacterized protein with von Willebrand factor type A (vWA) domain